MNAGVPSFGWVHMAYSLLKQNAYYDKMDLFLRANVTAYEAIDLFQQWQDILSAIIDNLRKGAPSPKSQRAIKVWQESDYATFIAVVRKIPDKILQEDPKLLMGYDQAATRTGGEV